MPHDVGAGREFEDGTRSQHEDPAERILRGLREYVLIQLLMATQKR